VHWVLANTTRCVFEHLRRTVVNFALNVALHSAFSNELNQSRISVLKDREECLQTILSEAIQRLADVGKPTPEYKALLQSLITEVS
jgi:hypothetical protein